MFFEDVSEIEKIARRIGTAIFVIPPEVPVEIKNAIVLKPDKKTVISIDQVQELLKRLKMRQVTDLFVIIRPAEALGNDAANALLKSLEEPGEKVHFVLVTNMPSLLLPTILSRAEMFFLKTPVSMEIKADEKIKDLAKRLLVAKGADLVAIAEEIGKKKEGVREYALCVVGTAIEILYKSYFITGKEVFLSKLPKFLTTYESLSRNGHVKLQIVSNLC